MAGETNGSVLCLVWFSWRSCFQNALLFVWCLCILLHKIHALLWFVPIIKAEILALSIQIRLCVCSPGDLRSLWKADLVTLLPGDCLAVNTHIKRPKLPASASLSIFFLLLYFICFSKCTTFLLKPFCLVASTLKCSYFYVFLFQTLEPCIVLNRGTEWVGCSRNGLRISQDALNLSDVRPTSQFHPEPF